MDSSNFLEIESRFKYAIILTGVMLVLEIGGGIWTKSLALLSDASHLFMDAFSLSLSLIAHKISHRPATDTKTYGYHRLEIFAAFINGVTLVVISLWIFYEGWKRISTPKDIVVSGMMVIALIGFIVNCITIAIIKNATSKDVNLKSAFYHTLGDTITSLGVIITGIIIYFSGWAMIDPIISIIIGLVIMVGSLKIISESMHVLLEGVPRTISLEMVIFELRGVEGVKDIHELHIWGICSNVFALSTHVLINDQMVSDVKGLLKKINYMLKDRFNISHTTIQFETERCLYNLYNKDKNEDNKYICRLEH